MAFNCRVIPVFMLQCQFFFIPLDIYIIFLQLLLKYQRPLFFDVSLEKQSIFEVLYSLTCAGLAEKHGYI